MTTRGHASRDDRERDRRRPVRDDRAAVRDDPPSRSGRGEALNDFFMDGKGIHREVLQREICKYLGPEAFSRPYNYNGVSGYTITAVRPFTSVSLIFGPIRRLLADFILPNQKMIDDLQELSRSYVNENREAVRKGHQDIPYEQSKTALQAIRNQGIEDAYDQPGYPSHIPYSMAGAQPGYLASSRPEYPPTQAGAYPGSMYPSQGSGYPQGPSYGQASPYPSSARPGSNDPYNPSYGGDPYGDESPRPSYPAGSRREVRVDPRVDPRDLRDPRLDPRADPRGADLRGSDPRSYSVAEPRMDYRDVRDPRADPRVPSYSYPVTSPADVQMRGYNDDYPAAPVQMGRGGPAYAPPSRVVQSGYDPRESVQMRDAYRHEPIREERRRR